MAKKITRDIVYRILNCYYIRGMTFQEIADKFGLSKTRVFNIVENARKNNLVTISINDPEEDLRKLENAVDEKFGLKECIVVRSIEPQAKALQNVAIALESFFDRNILKDLNIGIGWGKTLGSFSSMLQPKGKKYNVNIIPLTGGLGHIDTGLSTNTITSHIAKAYGGTNFLINFPGIVNNENLRNEIMKDHQLQEIFKSYEKIDIAFIGLSSMGTSATNLIDLGYVRKNEYEDLKKLGIIGDINLNFINEDGIAVENFLKHRIINADLQTLKKIPTVVVAAIGLHKVPVVIAALKNKLFNVLITDEKNARELLKN